MAARVTAGDLLDGPAVAIRVFEEDEPDVVERGLTSTRAVLRWPTCDAATVRRRRAGEGARPRFGLGETVWLKWSDREPKQRKSDS